MSTSNSKLQTQNTKEMIGFMLPMTLVVGLMCVLVLIGQLDPQVLVDVSQRLHQHQTQPQLNTKSQLQVMWMMVKASMKMQRLPATYQRYEPRYNSARRNRNQRRRMEYREDSEDSFSDFF
jgi:hypothetical protein